MSTKNDNGGITYQHIPNVGKTIATLDGVGNNVENIIWKLVINNSRFLGFVGCNDEDCKKAMNIRNTYRSICKVNVAGGDVYSEEEGKSVAHGKVMKKYHKNLDSNLRAFLTDVRNLAAGVEHYLDKRSIDYSKVPTVEDVKNSRFSSK